MKTYSQTYILTWNGSGLVVLPALLPFVSLCPHASIFFSIPKIQLQRHLVSGAFFSISPWT